MRRLRDDRGAAAVFIAVIMVVLIALVGLAVDVGALYAERRELSRAADAAVLAIAEDCALEVKPCDDATAGDTAASYADANADDGAAGIHSLDLNTSERRVTVETSSETAEGEAEFQLFFMRVLGFDSAAVGARATAVWGYPSSGSALPIIFSNCEFHGLPPPSEANPQEVTLFFHTGGRATDCAAVAGQDTDGDDRLAGGFGWLDTDGNCVAIVTVGEWVGEDPGASPSRGCGAAELRELILNKTVLIPFFSDVDGLGQNGRYRIAGLAAFHVTGYNFGGQFKEPTRQTAPCDGADRCVRGWYERHTVYDGDLGGQNYGVVVVKLTE